MALGNPADADGAAVAGSARPRRNSHGHRDIRDRNVIAGAQPTVDVRYTEAARLDRLWLFGNPADANGVAGVRTLLKVLGRDGISTGTPISAT
jgi:hypothetical protein